VFHTLKKNCAAAATTPMSATRAASRPTSPRREALDSSWKAIEQAGFKPGEDIVLALDCAATEFFKDGKYELRARARSAVDPARVGQKPSISPTSCAEYPIVSIEDGMSEDDWEGWKALTDLVGDKLPARRRRSVRHQPARLAQGHRRGAANSILVKVNQIGTLTETLEAVEMAHAQPATRP
jgi:enolase